MNARVRVLPPFPKRGLFPLGIALGLAHGLIGAWLIAMFGEDIVGFGGPVSTFGMFRVAAMIGALFLLPAIPIAMLVVRVRPRMGRLLACGAFYGAGCFFGVLATIIANNPETLLTPWSQSPVGTVGLIVSMALGVVVGTLAMSAAFLGAFAMGLGVERVFGKRLIEQTGFVCWTCGYDLGSPAIGSCPECGGAFDAAAGPRSGSARVLAMLVRFRRWVLVLAVIGAIGPVASVVVSHTIPSVRFLRACPDGGVLQQSGMMGNYVMRPNGRRGTRAVMPLQTGWWIPDSPEARTGIAVQFVARAEAGEATMFVSRACLTEFTVPAGAVIGGPPPKYDLVAPGTMRIRARLTEAQAARVIESRTVPAGLVEALRKEADDGLWKSADPMVVPATTEVNVDAAKYFP